ncbi:MAG: UvrB/UvrC motif-containing protein [Muribaculaceae bacterium]|nr:UvrB/UvrC motif-containing protein [Muribaculaceae bacterium]
MQKTIDETERRRAKQQLYNEQHGITPTPIVKKTNTDLIELYQGTADTESASKTGHVTPGSRKDAVKKPISRISPQPRPYLEEEHQADALVADPVVEYMSPSDLKARIAKVQADMTKAAKAMDFMEAARLRDEMLALKELAEAKSPAENV